MTSIEYLNQVLQKYNTFSASLLPQTQVYQSVFQILNNWATANNLQGEVKVSGSNAKGTAIAGEADVDLFLSLHPSTLDRNSLADIYNSLVSYLRICGYLVRRQNVSARINHGGVEVDIVPGVKFSGNSNDHWLHITKSGRDRTKTNIDTHISRVINSGRIPEIRLTKIWRKINNLDFPSIYLEECVINSLSGYRLGNTDANFLRVLDYLSANVVNARIVDPANYSNIISEDLTLAEKQLIRARAVFSRSQPTWQTIVW